MAIKKHKPTSPGRRFATWLQHEAVTKGEPEKSLTEGLTKSGGRNNARPRHLAPPRRRGQAPLPQDRLQAPQGRRAGQGRRDRVRPEPLGAHRAAALRRRREALHPRAGADGGRRRGLVAARTPTSRPATACRSPNIPTGTTVHNVELTPGRGGQLGRSAGTSIQLVAKEGELRDPAPALGRDAHGPARLPRHDRRARQRRARAGRAGQGRPLAPPRQAPADARRGHEPGRPPARRRRGAPHARRPPGHALGRADARLPHAQEAQGVRPVHRPRPPARQEGEAS